MKDFEKMNDMIQNIDISDINAGAGGEEVRTVMKCEFCGYEDIWAGDYMNGVMYMCPEKSATYPVFGRCFSEVPSFHGIRYHHYKE